MNPDYDRAARMAYKTLLALHIESLPIDPLMILSFCKNTVVTSYEDLMSRLDEYDYYWFKQYYMDGREALTLRKELANGIVRYELFYGNRGNLYRRRFTLAHELGHIILKHCMEAEWEDKEADYFAAQLLAPLPLLHLLREQMERLLTAEVVSDVFCLSKAAATNVISNQRHVTDDDLYRMLQRQFGEYIEESSHCSSAMEIMNKRRPSK